MRSCGRTQLAKSELWPPAGPSSPLLGENRLSPGHECFPTAATHFPVTWTKTPGPEGDSPRVTRVYFPLPRAFSASQTLGAVATLESTVHDLTRASQTGPTVILEAVNLLRMIPTREPKTVPISKWEKANGLDTLSTPFEASVSNSSEEGIPSLGLTFSKGEDSSDDVTVSTSTRRGTAWSTASPPRSLLAAAKSARQTALACSFLSW